MELSNENISLLSGHENFTDNGNPIGLSIHDFWRFQYSNIWDMLYKGVKIEIKSTAYYHSWRSDVVQI